MNGNAFDQLGKPWANNSAKPIMISALDGHCGRPPALPRLLVDLVRAQKERNAGHDHDDGERQQEHGVPDHVDGVAHHFGIRLFTMSMRMCSLSSSVHGEHSRNTALNSTHCSSSQEFDDEVE